jgi:hypothetical protein
MVTGYNYDTTMLDSAAIDYDGTIYVDTCENHRLSLGLVSTYFYTFLSECYEANMRARGWDP